MADVEFAVQVIGLVQESAGQQFFTGFFEDLAVNVLGADRDVAGTSNIFAEIGDAEASFTLGVAAFGVNDFGINEDEFGLGILFECDVDDRNAAGNADLRSGQSRLRGRRTSIRTCLSTSFCNSSSKTVTLSEGFSRTGLPNLTMG